LNITARSEARKKDFFIDKAIKEAAAIQLLPGFGRTRALGAWSGNILSTRELDLNRPHKSKADMGSYIISPSRMTDARFSLDMYTSEQTMVYRFKARVEVD
jgi:hypothetical protein